MNTLASLGLDSINQDQNAERQRLQLYINLKLALLGHSSPIELDNSDLLVTANDLLRSHALSAQQQKLSSVPVDQRINQFLEHYLADLNLDLCPKVPANTLELDRYGLARELSLPKDGQEFHSEYVDSFRVKQGILHNPANDRRTTQGSFHIAEGGLPIPGDKKAVPKSVFANLLIHALNPPAAMLNLPYFAGFPQQIKLFVSLLIRPIVCPEIPGVQAQKNMEIRFFAPGNLVSNLDFVESIFGNGGNPALPEYDAALDLTHWSGHSGCVILAPHLNKLSKKALGLKPWSEASDRQRAEGMCWQHEDELYNDGQAFKICARDDSGVIITLLADNYYGYCKKEVKTQISFAANLSGLSEEEHAGGALAFERRNHGDEYGADSTSQNPDFSFKEVIANYGDLMQIYPEGYAVDKQFPEIIYLPEKVRMDLNAQKISWLQEGQTQSIRLQPNKIYIQPSGYKIEMLKHPGAPSWRLVGTEAEGTFCHKPCTVSGGGKSEISKSIEDAIIYNSLYVNNLKNDLDRVQDIFDKDYSKRFKPGHEHEDHAPERKLLSEQRSLGSVIKLLTYSSSYTDEFNTWLKSIPSYIFALVFIIKRFYRKEWGDTWREQLSVDIMDGAPGHELKLQNRKIIASYLRIGFDPQGGWRTFKVRQDFIAAEKIQMEDDISASVTVPTELVKTACAANFPYPYLKLVANCEYRFFQRPDDAIHPGYDKQTELNMSQNANFIANFEALNPEKLATIVEDVLNFNKFSPPMQQLLHASYMDQQAYVVSSAHPRLVNGKPSKNPRYLETRSDLIKPLRRYVADMGARLHRKIPLDQALCHPVDAVLCGRRNNPPEGPIRSLAVYNPIHYQELPELFMDFISSLTGKSPSTTGAGSEGAMTKGPFNALYSIHDLNNALKSFILTGYPGFSSSAGYIGPNFRVDHDISLLIPEIWTKLKIEERQPEFLIKHGYLAPINDFEFQGKTILASRLGYRITERFVHDFLGKIFDNPGAVFTHEILEPETQDLKVFVDGINNIVETQNQVAQLYFEDGSIELACKPLKALLHIMAYDHFDDLSIHDQEFRLLFSRHTFEHE